MPRRLLRVAVVMLVSLAVVGGVFSGVTAADATQPMDTSTLRRGSPREADLIPRYIKQLVPDTRQGLATQSYGHPAYPGAVVLAARNGIVASSFAVGFALRYQNPTTELPRRRWIRARKNTIYDLASLSKIFTATLAVQQLAKGRIHLNESVTKYLPEFAEAGKGGINIRMLLTHTSGLAADPVPALWDPIYTSNDQRWAALFATVPVAAPGAQYLYSDINFMIMARVIEKVTGKTLDQAVRKWITAPLGMKETMYNPPQRLRHRIAATEYQEPPTEPARGMVWGQVQDENAWALGGVAGHAGLFGTAHDLAVFCQTILNGGAYGDVRIYPKSWAASYFRNYNMAYPSDGHSLVMQVNQYPRFFGAMDTDQTIGHTGYSGTSLVIDPHSQSFNVMLTNRVHPTREWTPRPTPNPQRRAVGDDLARAIAVKPASGTFSWFSGMANNALDDLAPTSPATLTVPVERGSGSARLRFNLWYRLVPSQAGPPAETAVLQSSLDGGQTWSPLPFRVRKHGQTRNYPDGGFTGLGIRGWGQASASLPPAPVGIPSQLLLRWEYRNAAVWQGRGVYINHVRVTEFGKNAFDDARPRDARTVIVSNGFRRSSN